MVMQLYVNVILFYTFLMKLSIISLAYFLLKKSLKYFLLHIYLLLFIALKREI